MDGLLNNNNKKKNIIQFLNKLSEAIYFNLQAIYLLTTIVKRTQISTKKEYLTIH